MSSKIKTFFGNTHVYIINLKDSTTRRQKIIDQFDGYENLHIMDAVDGRDPKTFKMNYDINYTSPSAYTSPVIAVICSHAKAIKLAYDMGYDHICVFEDDVHLELINQYPYTLTDIMALGNDWELIQLYYCDNLQLNYNHYKTNGLNLIRRNMDYTGSCYVINRKGMESILNNVIITNGIDKFRITQPIVGPEDLIFNYVISYIINFPCIYYCSDDMTFTNYIEHNKNDKTDCQLDQKKCAKLLKSFYN
jgi:GR25 family glycosyltransferase involved in LPS biosynthesis